MFAIIVIDIGPGTYPITVICTAAKFDMQVMAIARIAVARSITVDHGFIINIINDHIHRSVIIQIGINRSVRESGRIKAPVIRHIVKLQIALIFKSKVWNLYHGNLVEHLLLAGNKIRLRPEVHKIMVRNIARVTVGNDQIAVTIIVKIGKQWSPAPICL